MPLKMVRPIEQLKDEAIERINARAGEIITTRLPQWKQANLTARAVELNHRAGLWTQAETAEWDAIQAEWDWVKSIRAKSNSAVSSIDSVATAAQIKAIEAGAFL